MKIKIIHGAAVLTCEPVTVAIGTWLGASAATAATTGTIALAGTAAAIGAGVSGYGMYQAGQSQKKAGEYNAEMDRRRAADSLQRGAIEASGKRDQARKIASTQAEGGAMSGVALDYGSPLALLTETAGLGELAALRTTNNATREAWGLQAQATLDEFQGNAAGRAGTLNAAGTFLGGASNAYMGYKAGTK